VELKSSLKILGLGVGAVCFVILALLLAHNSPLEAATTLIKGSLGSASAITGTLRETTPLLIAGLAVFIALRAGLFNIGVEGQLLVGALACAVVALRFPGAPGLVLGAIAAAVAGALWALPAGLIKAYRSGHEVITTIMFNYLAGYLTFYLVNGRFKDPHEEEATTRTLTDATRLHPMNLPGGVQLSPGLILGVIGCGVLWWWLSRTVAGYELRVVGANPTASKFAGVRSERTIVKAMLASGAIAGLAGAVQVLAYEGRFYSDFSPGYGFDALGVALLAGGNALAVLPAGLLFGILAKGGTMLQIDGIPKGITTVILGLVILIAAAIRYREVRPVA
jgi:ABC-type uncharacterized transport system permease subunit